MNIRLTSPSLYITPNNKPKIAFRGADECFEAFQIFHKENDSESLRNFQLFAKTVEPHEEATFLARVEKLLEREDTRPVIKKMFYLIFKRS